MTSPFNAGSFAVAEAASVAAAASLAANDAANAARIAAQTAVVTTPTIVVNVTGAIDSEGTARTIVNTLNNSYFRGTGGANQLVAE